MVAVSSLGFSVYEQYTSNSNADGSSSQSGDLQAGVTVGTDDGSKYGSSVILDVKQVAAAKKISDGMSAVDTLTKVANYERTQVPKDAASGRLAQAIQELRALNLVGGGIHSVQQAARIAQDSASALRDLASAEQSTAADGNPADASEGASAGAAAAAASAALSGASDGSAATAPPMAATAPNTP